MKLDELTLAQVKQLRELFSIIPNNTLANDAHWEIGKPYLIRTVTMIELGILVAVTPQELVLRDAAWIADTGRWMDALRDLSKIKEVEPYPDGALVPVGRGALISACQVPGVLRSQK